MKLNFTNREYRTLMEMIQIASWVIHAHETERPTGNDPYDVIEEKILSQAKDFGCAGDVDFDKQLGAHFATRDFEEHIMQFIDRYDDDTFWEELRERLIERDMVRVIGDQQYLALEFEDRMKKAVPFEQKYDNEFAEHGIERLAVIAGPLATGHN